MDQKRKELQAQNLTMIKLREEQEQLEKVGVVGVYLVPMTNNIHREEGRKGRSEVGMDNRARASKHRY
jgi:hypothetical protein